MARIAGVDLPRNKRGVVGLTYIYGIGPSSATEILEKASIDVNTKVEHWTDDHIKAISRIIADEYKDKGMRRPDMKAHDIIVNVTSPQR